LIRIHPNKFILIHIPRTGGTSLKDSPRIQPVNMRMLDKRFHTPNHNPITIHHAPASYLLKEYRSHPKIAVIRNPWSKLVSLYNYADYARKHEASFIRRGAGEYTKGEKISFNEFIDGIDLFVQTSTFYKNHPYDHFGSQTDWLTEAKELTILRFEHLKEDAEKALGHSFDSWHNKGIYNDDYTSYYNEEQIEKVRQWYRLDIERFGWDFETTARNIR